MDSELHFLLSHNTHHSLQLSPDFHRTFSSSRSSLSLKKQASCRSKGGFGLFLEISSSYVTDWGTQQEDHRHYSCK